MNDIAIGLAFLVFLGVVWLIVKYPADTRRTDARIKYLFKQYEQERRERNEK